MTNRLWISIALLSLGGVWACGGSTQEQPEPTTTPEAPEATDEVPSPPAPWDEMSMEQKQSWMAGEVMPRMAALFQEYDSERYANFSCNGCHGADMTDRNFAMPNPDILQLHPTGHPAQQQMMEDHPEMVRFMFQKVLPTMQTLLGAPDYDDVTETGFSCYACHASAVESAEEPPATDDAAQP